MQQQFSNVFPSPWCFTITTIIQNFSGFYLLRYLVYIFPLSITFQSPFLNVLKIAVPSSLTKLRHILYNILLPSATRSRGDQIGTKSRWVSLHPSRLTHKISYARFRTEVVTYEVVHHVSQQLVTQQTKKEAQGDHHATSSPQSIGASANIWHEMKAISVLHNMLMAKVITFNPVHLPVWGGTLYRPVSPTRWENITFAQVHDEEGEFLNTIQQRRVHSSWLQAAARSME